MFPLSWHGERAYSKSKAPTETDNQTSDMIATFVYSEYGLNPCLLFKKNWNMNFVPFLWCHLISNQDIPKKLYISLKLRAFCIHFKKDNQKNHTCKNLVSLSLIEWRSHIHHFLLCVYSLHQEDINVAKSRPQSVLEPIIKMQGIVRYSSACISSLLWPLSALNQKF